jgi:hypothetical protein
MPAGALLASICTPPGRFVGLTQCDLSSGRRTTGQAAGAGAAQAARLARQEAGRDHKEPVRPLSEIERLEAIACERADQQVVCSVRWDAYGPIYARFTGRRRSGGKFQALTRHRPRDWRRRKHQVFSGKIARRARSCRNARPPSGVRRSRASAPTNRLSLRCAGSPKPRPINPMAEAFSFGLARCSRGARSRLGAARGARELWPGRPKRPEWVPARWCEPLRGGVGQSVHPDCPTRCPLVRRWRKY